MKPLKKMCNEEKAVLLYELFPEEMQDLFIFSKATAETILLDADGYRASKVNLLHTSGVWYDLAKVAKMKLSEFDDDLIAKNQYLSKQLYIGNTFLFTFYCMHQYVISGKCMNQKFMQAIELLFFFR